MAPDGKKYRLENLCPSVVDKPLADVGFVDEFCMTRGIERSKSTAMCSAYFKLCPHAYMLKHLKLETHKMRS